MCRPGRPRCGSSILEARRVAPRRSRSPRHEAGLASGRDDPLRHRLRIPAALLIPAAPFVAAAAIGNNTAATPTPAPPPPPAPQPLPAGEPVAEIDYVDVGQGDGVVMRIGDQIVLSDAGQRKLDDLEAALKTLGAQKRIDVAILSHPHSDHVKNLLPLLKDGWRITTAVLSHSEWWEGTNTNKELISALKQQGTALLYVSAGQQFSWGGADWEILNPPEGKYTHAGQVADASVAYVLRLHTKPPVEALFTGDIGKSVASEVAKRWLDDQLGSATVYLATHHGSAAGSTDTLLDAVKPHWAVLSTGPNSYGHPTQAAIDRLEGHHVTIWCTDANGTISARVASDGTITWHTTKQPKAWWTPDDKATGTCVGRDH